MRNLSTFFLGALLAATTTATGCNDPEYTPAVRQVPASEVDAEFGFDETVDKEQRTAMVLARMHQFNQMQIEMGKMVREQADGDIRRLADRIVRDHEIGDRRVMDLASELDLTLPEPKMPERRKRQLQTIRQRLQTAEGATLGATYLGAIKQTHGDSMTMLSSAAPRVDEELYDLLEDVLPILSQHYALADLLMQGDARLQAVR